MRQGQRNIYFPLQYRFCLVCCPCIQVSNTFWYKLSSAGDKPCMIAFFLVRIERFVVPTLAKIVEIPFPILDEIH